MNIRELGEFGLIDRIRRMLPESGPGVLVGIGDDTAVLQTEGGRLLLATCDTQREGIHFLRSAATPENIGRKALAINLSDIASMGGRPRFALVSLGLPDDLPVTFIDGLYAGLRMEAELAETTIVGGNISSSQSGVTIDITLLGDILPSQVLLRNNAKPGDKILVTGTIGDAAAGVALILDADLTTSPEYGPIAASRRDMPTPRIRAGQWIAARQTATAMIDISDGLTGDLGHICESSKVGAKIFAEKLPVAKENRELAQQKYDDEWHFALHGGEDYELLFTVPAEQAQTLAAGITAETGVPVSIIGEILPAGQGQQFVLADGKIKPLHMSGWDHFKRNN